jgi:metal-sulfur cluster biosynthetic enzyme
MTINPSTDVQATESVESVDGSETPTTAVAGTSAADIAAAGATDPGAVDEATDLNEGKPAPDPESLTPLAESAGDDPFAADVIEAMKDVVDPELGINVVDLGLVYGVNVHDDHEVTLDMTLTSAACPLTDVIEDQTAAALADLVTNHTINWVWMPPWGPDKITDDGREQLRALGFRV